MEPGPLEAFTTDELIEELGGRFDCLVMMGANRLLAGEETDSRIFGSALTALALATLLRRRAYQKTVESFEDVEEGGE